MHNATPPARDKGLAPTPEEAADAALGGDAASSRGPVRHPRGIIAPSLPPTAPRWRRIMRGMHRLGHGLVLHNVLLAAPAMAFHFFLSLLPLLVFVGYIVGLIARRRGVDAVLSPLLANLPGTAESLVKKEVERLAGGGGATLGPVAAATFLWIASGGTHGLMSAIETVVGAPKRSWLKKRAFSVVWVAASLAAVAGASYALVKWDSVVHPQLRSGAEAFGRAAPELVPSSASEPPNGSPSVTPSRGSSSRRGASASPSTTSEADTAGRITTAPKRRRSHIVRSGGERALALALSLLFGTAVLATFYRFAVSHSRRVKRRVLPGAVLAVVLWLLVSWIFGVYVSTLAEYAVFYGSVAAVAVLLVWLWLTSLAILIGAEMNSQLEGLRD